MSKKEFFEKLAKVQGELKAPKGQKNSFGGYKYRSCEDILEAVKPLCVNAGLLLTITDNIMLVGDRYYIQATVSVSDSDEEKTVTAYAREAQNKKGMDESQVTGAASSYARKYALNGMFLIDDTKDADTDAYTKKAKSVNTDTEQAREDALAMWSEKELGKKEHFYTNMLAEIQVVSDSAALKKIEGKLRWCKTLKEAGLLDDAQHEDLRQAYKQEKSTLGGK